MISDRPRVFRGLRGRSSCVVLSAAVPFVGCILLAGCSTSQLNKHAVAVSTSLAPVVDQASAAYRDAVALHNQRAGYEAVIAYQNKDATYDPRNVPVLLSEKDIQTRLAVLAALQVYSKSLVELTQSSDSSQLDAASKSVGSNLTSLGNDLAPSVENVLGIAASPNGTTTTVTTVSGSTTTTITSSVPAPLLSPEVRNGISTAVNALGQFFVTRTVEKELPAKVEAMDPHIQLFCKTLDDDIHALDSIEQFDYDRIMNLENQFILQDEKSAGMNIQTRAEIMQLPAIGRQQKEAHARLSALRNAINNFALTHHALAAAAQNNNPESLKDKLSDLAGAGSSLGNFYSSLPSN
jgi:outer membrane murein-binding lipoprotein Lpp